MVQQHVNEDHGLDMTEHDLSDSSDLENLGFELVENEGRNANGFDSRRTDQTYSLNALQVV